MQKLIAITQRQINHREDGDFLENGWHDFLLKCNFIPIILPNNIEIIRSLFSSLKISGAILTGGGDIKSLGGNDFVREEIEEFLINKAIENNDFPLISVCRGMQKIQDFFGIKLYKVENHIVSKQKITINGVTQEVNSYHNFGTKENNNDEFDIFAIADDGVIKGIKHKKYNITGIMWHPERINPYRSEDIKLFCEVFQ